MQTNILKSIADTVEMLAYEKAEPATLYVRIAQTSDCVAYDLQNGNIVIVTAQFVTLERPEDVTIHFRQLPMQKEQTAPDFKSKAKQLLPLLQPFFRVTEDELLLLAIYLVSCFFQINHPILLLYGAPGSTKSTCLRTLQAIIDPTGNDVLSFPKVEKDFIATLTQGYYFAFDNMEKITKSQSTILCLASTGGTITHRQLFTNRDVVHLNLRRCIALDGVSVVVSAPDLLERCILMELFPPKAGERMTEEAYWKTFKTQLPAILGSLFDVIKIVLNDDNNDYQADCRMADFAQLGYKIANALGTGLGERFITIYKNNQKRAQEESKPPMALECISYLMEYKRDWTGTMSQLLHALRPIAIRLDYKNEFPCSANALSRQINKCKNRFVDYGLTWSQKPNGDRQIRIINKAPKAY